MEKENLALLKYFDRYKEKPNFEKWKTKLAKESEIKYKGTDIDLGNNIIMPLIGPDDNLKHFHKKIKKEWGEEISTDLKYAIKYYEGDEVENIEEAVIILCIKYNETKDEKFETLRKKIVNDEEFGSDEYNFLFDDYKEDILCNNLGFYIIKSYFSEE